MNRLSRHHEPYASRLEAVGQSEAHPGPTRTSRRYSGGSWTKSGAAEPHSLFAGQEVRKLAKEGAKKPAHDSKRKTPEARVSTASAEVPQRPSKKCRFAEMLNCVGTHLPWKCKALRHCPCRKRVDN